MALVVDDDPKPSRSNGHSPTRKAKGSSWLSLSPKARREQLANVCIFGAWALVSMAASYYWAQKRFKDRMRALEEEYERFLVLRDLVEEGEGRTCQSALETFVKGGAKGDAEDDGFSFSLLIIGVGCFTLGRFLIRECQVALQKRSKNRFKHTLSDLVSYRLDCFFSSSKLAKPLLLLAVTFLLILVSTVGLTVTTGDGLSTSMWRSWTYVADPGTHADAEGTAVRAVAFAATMGGMCVFALMISIISDYLGDTMDDLKRGKSPLVESRHTLMLGWTDMSLQIIQQIALANESEGGGTIAVLAKDNKADMEAILAESLANQEAPLELKGTEVLFRSGNTLAEHDLMKVSVQTARAIIALSEASDPDEADSRMVRQVLSLRAVLEKYGGESHVVCELRDVDNKELVELVGQGLVENICAHDIIGRIMLKCARAAGLAYVLENLMGFDGDEFYLKEWPELHGQRFGDISARFDAAVPIGLKHDGVVTIAPLDDQLIEAGDEILVLAEDDDSYEVNDGSSRIILPEDCKLTRTPTVPRNEGKPESILFCGWRRDIADMIKDLDNMVNSGSELWMLNSKPATAREELLLDKGNKEKLALKNLTVFHAVGYHYSRRDLRTMRAVSTLDGSTIPDQSRTLGDFDSVLVLAEQVDGTGDAPTDMEGSDSRSLACLMLVKDLQREILKSDPRYLDGTLQMCQPISEILDSRTRTLLSQVADVAYVLSNQIVSAAIAQVAESRDMNAVLGEMLRAEGCEVCLEPITSYLDPSAGEAFSFWEVYLLARKRMHDTPDGDRGEVAIGYKPHDVSWSDCGDTILNPSAKGEKRIWNEKDLLVIISP